MTTGRREFMTDAGRWTVLALAINAGLIDAAFAAPVWNKAAFDTHSVADTVKLLGGGAPVASTDITLVAPDIAENGAVVPLSVTTTLPKVTQIAFLVEKNPNTLAATFSIPPGTDSAITTRVKLGQSTDVYAVVFSDGKVYFAKREVKVTLGGCGG